MFIAFAYLKKISNGQQQSLVATRIPWHHPYRYLSLRNVQFHKFDFIFCAEFDFTAAQIRQVIESWKTMKCGYTQRAALRKFGTLKISMAYFAQSFVIITWAIGSFLTMGLFSLRLPASKIFAGIV